MTGLFPDGPADDAPDHPATAGVVGRHPWFAEPCLCAVRGAGDEGIDLAVVCAMTGDAPALALSWLESHERAGRVCCDAGTGRWHYLPQPGDRP